MAKAKTNSKPINLVIIESPYKAPTIKNYLGSSYRVVASKGHLRDLPVSSMGVDIDNGFTPKYINIRGKGDIIKELKKEAKNADKIFFATDPDREGEAISWHLANVLGIPVEETRRVCFNELTKNAIKTAIKEPRNIDMDLVDSQQARRILDRIIGYELSPMLWKTVKSHLSAGRVQSVATRIVVDRENEINSFVPQEYWTVDADLVSKRSTFTARYWGENGEKSDIIGEKDAERIKKATEGGDFNCVSVKKTLTARVPMAPFTTSTLQQEASRKLGFRSKKTMQVAQELYEGINLGSSFGGTQGLITYMRTDSVRISDEAASAAEAYIRTKYGDAYVPAKRRVFKSKGKAQDAHEAIRPTNFFLEPSEIEEYLSKDQFKLYLLIWSRFMASQMSDARFDTVTAEFVCSGFNFRATGSTLSFNGFLAEYDNDDKESTRCVLPELTEGTDYKSKKIVAAQHFTEPPARFNEGTLVKFLEDNGIGRPSTFAPIISTIIDRGYVERDGKSLKPTELGVTVNKIMVENFKDIVDYEFTARLEDGLDSIAGGEKEMVGFLDEFYKPFKNEFNIAEKKIGEQEITVPDRQTSIICDKCGATMVIKRGRFGSFAACPNYPSCKNTKNIDKDGNLVEKKNDTAEKTGEVCPQCGAGLVRRKGKFGEFIACEKYPECSFTKEILKTIGTTCPDCGKELVSRMSKRGSVYYSCSGYPECKFMSWDKPTGEKCPECGAYLVEKKKGNIVCSSKTCRYTLKNE